MSDDLGNFAKDDLDTLLEKMRRFNDDGDFRYRTLHAELDRRVAARQIAAANAQVRSAQYQLWAVVTALVAALLAAGATLVAPHISN